MQLRIVLSATIVLSLFAVCDLKVATAGGFGPTVEAYVACAFYSSYARQPSYPRGDPRHRKPQA